MKVHIYRKNGKFIGTLDVSPDCTSDELKASFCDKYHFYSERQRYTIGAPNGPVLKDGSTLSSNGVTDETSLYFKDLGVQISWRLVFVLEYLGPLIIVPLLWCCPSAFYKADDVLNIQRFTAQKIAVILILFHFVKREIESLFVHRFSNVTMPLIRLPINCAHYWLLCGGLIGYYICHPKYRPLFEGVPSFILAALFIIFEIANFQTHIILRNLRPRGTRVRGVPQGCGFQWVSCANYLWETCAWVTYSVLTMCVTSYMFTIVAVAQMAIWALGKREKYRTLPEYPKSRKAMIPFFL